MIRAGIVVAALALCVASAPRADAQPQGPRVGPGMAAPAAPAASPAPPLFPPSPRVGPGTAYPAAPITQRPGTANTVFFPVILSTGWGVGWGYPTFDPWVGYGYAYGGIVPPDYFAPQVVYVERPLPPEPTVILAGEFPATLSIQFPAAAEVWLDGKKVPGAATTDRVLTSPVLKPDQKYTFRLKARWTSGGKTYETNRDVTLGSADRSRLMIVSGDPVKE